MNTTPSSKESAYEKYLQTEHWQNLRTECHAKYRRKCLLCRRINALQVHHFRYAKTFFDSVLSDLILLCEACHKMVHRRGDQTLSGSELRRKYKPMFIHEPEPKKAVSHNPVRRSKAARRAEATHLAGRFKKSKG